MTSEGSSTVAARKRWTLRRIVKWIGLSVLALLAILVVTGLIVANSKDGATTVLQTILYREGAVPNAFTSTEPPRDRVRADGLRVKTNLTYGTRYPNSFLDIWYTDANLSAKRPTVIYMHGGGFFMGSKDWGDPFASDGKPAAISGTVESMARAGLNVVNMDYALAPGYRYPTPLLQLNEAIAFLEAHSEELGLDMSRLFLMGSSAGAQVAAQYGALLSNPGYAAATGIRPVAASKHVRGLVLFSPPLKASGFGWRFNAMLWSYLDTKDLENSKAARELDIVPRVTANYLATYITDGNQPDTFPEHAKSLARALRARGVDHVFNYHEPSEVKLDHGYTGRLETRWGRDNLARAIDFMLARGKKRPQVSAARVLRLDASAGRRGRSAGRNTALRSNA